MLKKDDMIEVLNRDNGTVGYTIPDLNNLHRNFESGEVKKISMDELTKLSYIPGGIEILRDYLVIKNDEAIEELLGGVEPEYKYDKVQITNLLLKGSLDELKDCLDFAPEGVIDLIKQIAVELKLNDIQKREAIQASTGFNINSAVLINEDTVEEKPTQEKIRRVVTTQTAANTSIPTRRIISKQ